MQLITEELRRRFEEVDDAGEIRDVAERRLHSLLVLDPETLAVFEVWLAFVSRARVDPALAALRDQTHAEVRGGCRAVLEALGAAGRIRPGLDLAAETEHLHALVDGLALHATHDPGVTTPRPQVELLSRHLDTLA